MECKMESFLYEDTATHKDGKSLALTKYLFASTEPQSKRLIFQMTSQENPKQKQQQKTGKATVW